MFIRPLYIHPTSTRTDRKTGTMIRLLNPMTLKTMRGSEIKNATGKAAKFGIFPRKEVIASKS